jgi:hypothetical protein
VIFFSDPTRFRQIIGVFQYLTFIRLDISYVVNKVCQFIYALIDVHWATVKHIMCYLKATTFYSLHITHCFSLSFQGFIDANWARGVMIISRMVVILCI